MTDFYKNISMEKYHQNIIIFSFHIHITKAIIASFFRQKLQFS